MDDRLQRVMEVADAIEADGLAGFLTALPRMVGEGGAAIFGCVTDADFCMGDAGSAEEYWGCAVGMAACIRDVRGDVAPPEPPEQPPEPPEPDPEDPRWPRDPATLALAVLLFQLRRDRGYRSRAKGA